jgi:predicted GNAT family acetyltransferase
MTPAPFSVAEVPERERFEGHGADSQLVANALDAVRRSGATNVAPYCDGSGTGAGWPG